MFARPNIRLDRCSGQGRKARKRNRRIFLEQLEDRRLLATITAIGQDNFADWQSTSVVKAHDTDGDNIVGEEGFVWYATKAVGGAPGTATANPLTFDNGTARTLSSIPTYLSLTSNGQTDVSYAGTLAIDNPVLAAAATVSDVEAGAAVRSAGARGSSVSVLDIRITEAIPAAGLRIGIVTPDVASFNDENLDRVTLAQVTGGAGTATFVRAATGTSLAHLYFDIVGAVPGDVFRLSLGTLAGSTGANVWYSGLTFDAIDPTVVTGGTGPGGFKAVNITGDIEAWFKADALSLNDNDPVASWTDSSGKGDNANAVSATARPRFVDGQLNGQPVVRFAKNPTSDDLSLGGGSHAAGNDFSFFAVVRPDGIRATEVGFFLGSNAVANDTTKIGPWTSPSFFARLYNNASSGSASWPADTGSLEPRIIYVQRNSADVVTSSFDGATPGAPTSGQNGTSRINRIGGPVNSGNVQDFPGDIAELAFFGSALTRSQQVIAANYLSSKYGISLNVGGGAQDVYQGDEPTFGDYDLDVFGIGRASGNDAQNRAGSAGLGFYASGSFDVGDFLMAGHQTETNALVATDLPAGIDRRWERVWNVDSTGQVETQLAFSFADAGLAAPTGVTGYRLLYSASNAFESGQSPMVDLNLTPTILGDKIVFELPAGLSDGYYTLGLQEAEAVLDAGASQGDLARDSFRLVRNGSDIEFYVNGSLVRSTPAAELNSITVNGSSDDDTLHVDHSAGSISVPVSFVGGGEHSAPGDLLRVTGSSVQTAIYLPDAATPGAGTVTVDGIVTAFAGLEPVDLEGMLTAEVYFPNGAENITVQDGLSFGGGGLPAIIVSGTSGVVGFETIALRGNTNVIIDTVALGSDGVDLITLSDVGLTANQNTNLSINTGSGSVDMVAVDGTVNVTGTLSIATQQINLNPGASLQATDVTLDAGTGSIADGDPGMLDVTTGTLTVSAGAGGIDLDIVATTLISNTSSGNGNQTFSQVGGTVGVQSLNAGTGTITLDQGTFSLLGAGSIADSSRVTVNTPGVLSLNGFDEAIASLGGNGTVDLGSNQLTVGGDNANITFTGTLVGTTAATVNKVGSGDFNLNSLTSVAGYLGSWSVGGGALVVDGEGRLGPTPAAGTADYITLYNGGTLLTQGTVSISGNRGISLGVGGGRIETFGALSVNTQFVGGTGLTKAGPSNLILQQDIATNFFGTLNIESGQLFFQTQTSLGTGPVHIASGATLNHQAGGHLTLTNQITIASGGGIANRSGTLMLPATTVLPSSGLVVFNDDDQATMPIVLAGGVVLTGDLAIQVGGGNTTVGPVEIRGAITGTGGITKSGASGVLTLDESNSYDGVTNVNEGVLVAAESGALGSTVAGTVVAANATLTIWGSYVVAEPVSVAGSGVGGEGAIQGRSDSANTFAGPITLLDNVTIGVPVLTTSLTLGGPISGAFDLTKVGPGFLVLSGSNTYGGDTQIENGVVQARNGAAIPDSSTVTLGIGGAVFYAFDSETIGALTGSASGFVAISAGQTLTTGANNASTTYSGIVRNGGDLTKVGSGTFTLELQDDPANQIGLTTVDGGLLLVNTTLPADVFVNAGGTLGGTGEIDGALNVNGGTVSPGVSPGILEAGNTTFVGGNFDVEIGGPTPGDGPGFHDQLKVTGTVDLGGATLNVISFGGFDPAGGDAYVIVSNDGVDPMVGTFAGLAEGALVSANFLGSGLTATITYLGGDGNDATIVVSGDVEYTGDTTGEDFELRRVAIGAGFIQLLRNGVVVDSRPASSISSYTINAGDGDDSLYVNYGGNGGVFTFPVTFNGQGQVGVPGDTLQVGGGSATTVEHTFVSDSSGDIDIDGRVINYSGLEPIIDNMVAANRIFTFTGAAETVTLSDDGVASNEQSRIDSTLGEVVTFTNATLSLTINLTNGADVLNVEGLDSLEPVVAAYSADLTITQDGGDTVSFQSAATNLGAGALSVTAEVIAFSATVTTTGDATLTALGAITTAGAGLDLMADDLVLSAGSGADLDTTVATLTATITGAGNLQIDETDALQIDGLAVTAGNATVLAGGALSDSASATINVPFGTASFGGTTIVLGESAGNATNFGSLTFNSASAVNITEDSATNLTGTSTAATLELTSAAALTDAALTTLTVTGNADLSAASIALGDSVGDTTNFGSVTFNSAGAVVLFEDSATELTGINSAATLSLASASALTDAAATTLTVTGNASLSGNSITLGDDAADVLNFGTLTVNSIGAVVITEDSDAELAGPNTAGSLDLTSPLNITDSVGTSLAVTGNAIFDGASITLGDNAGDTTNFGSLNFSATGSVAITEDSAMVLVGASVAAGAITLTTTDLLAAGQDLTVSAGASVTSTGAGVVLNVADNATIAGAISSAAGLAISLDAGAIDPGVGSAVSITGPITTATGSTITGGGDDDTFNLAPQTTTSFAIDGGAPVLPVTPGDTLNLDLSGVAAGNTVLTLGVTPGSGSYSFAAQETELEVSFTSIETNNATGSDYHLVLDMTLSGFQNGVADAIDAQLNSADLELRVNGSEIYAGAAAAVRSLTVIGSSDSEVFTVTETASGVPNFVAAAPAVNNTLLGGGVSAGSHLNGTADAVYAAETVADVTIHFVGGGGTNGLAFDFASAHDVGYVSDTVGAASSGNVGVQPLGGGAAQTLVSFVGAATLNLDGMAGNLTVDASSTPLTSAITIDSPAAGVTRIGGDVGLATTSFNDFTTLTVRGGSGAETIDLVATAGPPLTGVTLSGSNFAGTDNGNDTIRVQSLPAGVTATLIGGIGSDTFRLGNLANTVDNILGAVVVNGTDGNIVGQTDSLFVVDSGSLAGTNVTINESQVDGLTGFGGVDVTFTNIDALEVTATGGADTISSTFVAGSDLNTAVVNGAGGADQFFLSLPDVDPVAGTPSGLTSVALNGNADNDTFGSIGGPRIQPSRTTAISINGGPPTPGVPPTGDTVGDVLNVDISLLPTTSAVVVSTVPGLITATGYAGFTFDDIEDINLFDSAGQTDVQMGDLYVRTTDGNDRVTFVYENPPEDPFRTRMTVNYVVTYIRNQGRMFVYGLGGDDVIHTLDPTNRPVTFDGGDGQDYIAGGLGDDLLIGGLGADQIIGGIGDDELWGDNYPTALDPLPQNSVAGGFDRMTGGDGNDIMYGGGSGDQMWGNNGDDYMHGGQGNDDISGDDGNDRIYGSDGNDILGGISGNDLLVGGGGSDWLMGKHGNDVLLGGFGADELVGEDGNDLIVTGSVANEQSNFAGDANDMALAALLLNWGTTGSDRTGLAAITQDGLAETVYGGTGDDDFSVEAIDLIRDFNYPSGNDQTF